jgi:hypothetical protein
MIDFVTGRARRADWTIDAIGIAQRSDGVVQYRPLDGRNIERDDALGEFLNRPLFILRSRHVAADGHARSPPHEAAPRPRCPAATPARGTTSTRFCHLLR